MDTKSKKNKIKPVRSLIALTLTIVLTGFYVFCAIFGAFAFFVPQGMNYKNKALLEAVAGSVISGDVSQSTEYVRVVFNYFNVVADLLVSGNSITGTADMYYDNLETIDYYFSNNSNYSYYFSEDFHYNNVTYYAEHNGATASGSLASPIPVSGDNLTGETLYSGIIYRDGTLYSIRNNKIIPVMEAGYTWSSYSYDYALMAKLTKLLPDAHIELYCSMSPVVTGSGVSCLYRGLSSLHTLRFIALLILAGIPVTLLLLVYTIRNRHSLSYIAHRISSLMSRILLEFKLIYLCIVIYIFLYNPGSSFNYSYNDQFNIILVVLALIASCPVLIDLLHNRSRVFKNNLINYFFNKVSEYNAMLPYAKSVYRHFCIFIIYEITACLSAALFLAAFILNNNYVSVIVFFLILSVAAAVYGIIRQMRYIKKRDRDINCLLERIKCISENSVDTTNGTLCENFDIREAYDALGDIYANVRRATDKAVQSERMKLELITNVSHDLKTPLTSIISYVELLSREENLSDAARDYISVIEKKSERLRVLISDLFDLSKASSRNITVNNSPIDLVRLCNQVNAELNDKIAESGLVFLTRCAGHPVIIYSDGMLLRRVIENLVINALKYSLPGSRVYIDVAADEALASYTIRNTTAEVIQCTSDELLARFVRGDNSRSTEGSGLGLSIARSYTGLCGGELELTIDGDLFKVKLTFPVYSGEPQRESTPEPVASSEPADDASAGLPAAPDEESDKI